MIHKGKRLLIIGGGAEQISAYEIARKLGALVVGSDQNEHAPAREFADDWIVASTRDVEETIVQARAFHKNKQIDGVVTIANDVPLTVASVAEDLGLPGGDLAPARITANKLTQFEAFRKYGVPTPETFVATTPDDVRQFVERHGFPIIIKPVDNRGARGVQRYTDSFDVDWAFDHARSNSQSGTVLVQKFINGYQVSSEGMVIDGRACIPMHSGRNYEYLDRFAPYVIENGGWLPGHISQDAWLDLDNCMQKAAEALGLKEGPIKGDLVLGPEGPIVLEIASRLGGGFASTHSIPATHGVDLAELVIRQALGEKIDPAALAIRRIGAAAIRFFLPQPGIVERIDGYDDLDALDWVLLKQMYVGAGDRIGDVTDHTKRAGCVIALGADIAEAEANVEIALKTVNITTRPDIGRD